MTAELDPVLVPVALDLIDRFGFDMEMTVKAEGTYDPATGTTSGQTETTTTRKGSPPIGYESKFIDGDHIRMGDVQIFVAGSGLAITPIVGMKIVFLTETWHAISIKRLYSGLLIAAWDIQLRK